MVINTFVFDTVTDSNNYGRLTYLSKVHKLQNENHKNTIVVVCLSNLIIFEQVYSLV